MGAEFTLIYLFTTELFPTVIRNISLGMGSTTARIGAIVAPFFVMMAQLPNISLIVPLCLFGGLAMAAALLSLMLPETLFKNMEQTVEEAEKVELDYNIPCCGKKHAKYIMNEEEGNRGQKTTEM
ncbi:solute carrier family 22 member 16-like [Exaiptasia diaphana]|nr:solute carrier family 22 member 16-like [Exaiptasia diaphana]